MSSRNVSAIPPELFAPEASRTVLKLDRWQGAVAGLLGRPRPGLGAGADAADHEVLC